MKNLVAIISLCVLSYSHAQSYIFSYFDAPYTELVGDTKFKLEDFDDNDFTPYVNLGFTFPYFGEFSFNEVSFYDLDFVWNDHISAGNKNYTAQLLPFGAIYSWGNETQLSYVTTGVAGKRIFKAQWKNMLLQNDTIGDQRMNIQMWLYEEDAAIEFRSGYAHIYQDDCYMTDEIGGTTVFVVYDNDLEEVVPERSVALLDSAKHPEMSFFYENNTNSMIGCMPSNFVYRFGPKNLNVAVNQNTKWVVSPNPTVETLVLSNSNEKQISFAYKVVDVVGNEVMNGQTSGKISVAHLQKGSYFLIPLSEEKNEAIPFIKN